MLPSRSPGLQSPSLPIRGRSRFTSVPRDFEREADGYAHAWLKRQGIPSHRFSDLLRRIELQESGNESPGDDGVWSYFSSHPSTQERAGD